MSLVLVHAIWPFLPESFRHHDFAMDAVAAWFTIANVVLRFCTKSAISIFRKDTNGERSKAL